MACPRPIIRVVTTNPNIPPPKAHKTQFFPALVAITTNQPAAANATGQGIQPIISLFSIFLRL
jgi:hypothetical protein